MTYMLDTDMCSYIMREYIASIFQNLNDKVSFEGSEAFS